MTQTTVVSRFRCGANTKLPSFIGGVYSFSVNTCVNHNNTFGRVCGFLREIIIELAFAGFRIVLFGFDYKWDTIFVSACAINEDKSIAVCFATKSYISQHWPHVLLIYVIRDIVSLRFISTCIIYVRFQRNSSITDTTIHCRCDENSMLNNCLCVFFFALAHCVFFFGCCFQLHFFKLDFVKLRFNYMSAIYMEQ